MTVPAPAHDKSRGAVSGSFCSFQSCAARLAMVDKTHKVLLHVINMRIHGSTHVERHHTTPCGHAMCCVETFHIERQVAHGEVCDSCDTHLAQVVCHVMSSNTLLVVSHAAITIVTHLQPDNQKLHMALYSCASSH